MEQITDKYGSFVDSPFEKSWCFNFKCLFLNTDHRKILNRQPEVKFFDLGNGLRIAAIVFDPMILSN